jgi:hypothetical protein
MRVVTMVFNCQYLFVYFQPDISSAEVVKFAENFSTISSCVIKIVEPRAHASLEDLKAVVLKVNTLEENKTIPPWDEEQIPEEIVSQSPEPGYYFTIISLLMELTFCLG